jgi:hypothetical protein
MSVLFGVDPDTVATSGDDWYTPRWLFEAAGVTFDMDVCAPMLPESRTCPAKNYLTVVDDGLSAPWQGTIWCNPPYSDVTPWVDRWAIHKDGLLLVPAVRSKWLGTLQRNADSLALIGGVDFHRPDGTLATIRQALVIAGRGRCASSVARIAAADAYAQGGSFIAGRG